MALAPTDVGTIEETTAIRLVAAHRCGDREAFDEIVRTHYPSLLATARHRLRNTEDAKDAVQETLLRALLALDRFGDTGDWRLGAWLNTILIHVCADIPAGRKPTVPMSDGLIERLPDTSEQPASDHVALAAVRRAIDALPESQRRAFELRLVDGRPYHEVAGTLGITEVNARARVRRARAALQNALESEGAVRGAWAAIPLAFTSPFRSALRRLFAGAGHPAREAGAQALASGAGTTGSSATSTIAGMPVQAGIQLITQVSATPLGQAVVASATSAPGKGSVVLGIVASLATAGGLAAPAAISGSTATPTTPQTSVVHSIAPVSAGATSAPTTAASPIAPPAASSSSSNGQSATSSASSSTTSTTTPPPRHQLQAPAWMTLAAMAAAYTISVPSAASALTASTAASSPTTTVPPTSPTSPTPPTAAPTSTTAPTSPASAAVTPANSNPSATPTGSTSPTPSTTSTANPVLPLPIGTCTGVTGFPGVTAPTSVPPLSSSILDAILSTGALGLTTATGSPAFAGTALVKPTGGTTAPVHVKVGTCLANGGSILAVDMTGTTGDEVQLVGALVAKPFVAATGADTYLFRGNVTQLAGTAAPGGALPWGLPQGFVGEVQVQKEAKTGSLTVVFLHQSAPTPSSSTAASAPGAPGSTSDAPTTTSTSNAGTATSGTGGAAASSAQTSPTVISGGSQTSI